jgi:hypothetical protein
LSSISDCQLIVGSQGWRKAKDGLWKESLSRFKKAEATTPDGPPSKGVAQLLMLSLNSRLWTIRMFGFGREQGVECRSLSQR